jgi:hypothetical protein
MQDMVKHRWTEIDWPSRAAHMHRRKIIIVVAMHARHYLPVFLHAVSIMHNHYCQWHADGDYVSLQTSQSILLLA